MFITQDHRNSLGQSVFVPKKRAGKMFNVMPLIRPVIEGTDPDSKHCVWFLLDEVNGTYNEKSGVSKSMHWLRNHLEISNIDHELVVPIVVTRDEYEHFFQPDAKEQPEEGVDAFLKARYEEQQPKPVPYGEAKNNTLKLKATYHPVAQGVSTQKYLPQDA